MTLKEQLLQHHQKQLEYCENSWRGWTRCPSDRYDEAMVLKQAAYFEDQVAFHFKAIEFIKGLA